MERKIRKKELLKRFREFCNGLSPKDRVAIVYHSDADGICSALVTARAVEKLTGRRPVVVQHYEYGNRKLAKKVISSMKSKKANILIIVDVAVDGEPHSVGETFRFEKCLVIDHHRMHKNLNGENLLFLKAEFFSKKDSSSYVASKLAFDLFSKLVDVEEMDWIACIGILGDMSLKRWQAFVKKTLRRRRISLTKLYAVLDLIAATEVLAGNRLKTLFWLLYEAEGPEQILKSPFKRYLKRFKKERDSLIRDFKKKAEYFPEIELFFYTMRARYENIKSYVINEISEMHRDKTIILLQYLGHGKVRFSARRQDKKVRVNDLLRAAVKGIPGSSAGGHAPAAAGSTHKKDVRKFKENVIKILKKNSS
jgi:single-stranded DNA-specific DHH superfamily exonuclease